MTTFAGYLEIATTDCIKGWAAITNTNAMHPMHPEPIIVEIFLNELKVLECVADQHRPDVSFIEQISPYSGFLVYPNFGPVPDFAKVYAKIRGETLCLGGSGRYLQPAIGSFECASLIHDTIGATQTIIGSLDSAGGGKIQGWAGTPGSQQPVVVELYLDGEKLADCTTGEDRPDVAIEQPDVGGQTGFSTQYATSNIGYLSRVFARPRGTVNLLPGSGKFIIPAKSPKLFFIHIPKTGGTTLIHISQYIYERAHHFIPEQYEWHSHDKYYDFEFLAGHIYHAEAINLYRKHGFLFFTMLRDPQLQFPSNLAQFVKYVDAIVTNPTINVPIDSASLHIFHELKATKGDFDAQVECIRRMAEEQAYREVVWKNFENSTTRFLASVPQESPVTASDMRRAKEVIDELDFIGMLSEFIETLHRLTGLTGRPWNRYSKTWMNKGTGGLDGREGRDKRAAASFEEFIWSDLEVYERATKIFRTHGGNAK